jgi:hypothetical protein
MRKRSGCLLLLALLAAGCNDNTTAPPPTPEPLTWIGSYSDGSGSGTLSLDIVKTGNNLTGEVVITRVPELDRVAELFVRGTFQNGVLHAELDTHRIPYQYTFTIDADTDASSNLSGTVVYPLAGVNAPVVLRPLPRRTLAIERSFVIPSAVFAMVFDDSLLWLSTLNFDYLRFTPDGVFQDKVAVYYGDAHWVSDALTFDGTHLIGVLPTSTQGPGGTVNGSHVFEFNAAAGITRTYDLPFRTSGLAWDGTYYWSLTGHQLKRFDATGAVSDSVAIDVPDAYHLEFDGAHFWTTSWYTLKLYEVGQDGKAIAIVDLPLENTGGFQSGIAVEGSYLWYGEELALESTKLFRLRIN